MKKTEGQKLGRYLLDRGYQLPDKLSANPSAFVHKYLHVLSKIDLYDEEPTEYPSMLPMPKDWYRLYKELMAYFTIVKKSRKIPRRSKQKSLNPIR